MQGPFATNARRDEGLTFRATIRKADGTLLNRETPNRLEYLSWIEAHDTSDDELTVTVEARGSAARQTLMALRFGAIERQREP